MDTLTLDPDHARALARDLALCAASTPSEEAQAPTPTPGTLDLIPAFVEAARTLNRRRVALADHVRDLAEAHAGPGGHIDTIVGADTALAKRCRG
ncbi:hypothetical protein M0E87_00625 [Corynebacterium sp. CCM 9185]|uniref:HNH endonuclease n=1 Tax=Corynebacterium marambiense TaxID=2765364 RepID=A0ABS0VY91_9CORY|nr:hypothetical protein [Corynebacterium marambiense]MBI9001710.1 hypothetical protein [Corynebacterium marambiense]MCK7662175.1 hypothetical protein [Corynebacterium marambiense]MCX7541444.1 hypothetical protein [Corynebacterium marambiense]